MTPEREKSLREWATVDAACWDCFIEIDRLRTVMTDMADELGSYISAGRINCVGADNVVAGLRHAVKAAGGE